MEGYAHRVVNFDHGIKIRFDLYNEQTKPLIEYYSESNRLRVVDGMESVAKVNALIESFLSA